MKLQVYPLSLSGVLRRPQPLWRIERTAQFGFVLPKPGNLRRPAVHAGPWLQALSIVGKIVVTLSPAAS
jgi:hypothetical protein